MAEERMLNDEILLGLIKANSGGGGGGTNNYNQLENKPQIAGTTLQGNKTLSDLGIASATALGNVSNAVTAITNGQTINSFSDVETALTSKQNALTAGDYISLNNGNIAVNRNLVGDNYDYEIKSTGDYKLTIIKSQGGTVISTNTYDYSYGTSTNIDNNFTIAGAYSGGNTWVYTALKDSTTHSVGYTWTKSVDASFEETESFPSEDLSGYKLVIKSELDTALSGKQDTTDNSLETTDKTIVGAINEHEGDISTLKSGLTNYENQNNLNLEVTNRKNLLPMKVSTIKSINTSGTWSGDTYTLNGMTFTVTGDAQDNLTSVTLNDKATANCYFMLNKTVVFDVDSFNSYTPSNKYKAITGTGSGGDVNSYSVVYQASNHETYIRVAVNYTSDNITLTPMITELWVTDATFTPYIPSVESRIEAVESGVTNINTELNGKRIRYDGGTAWPGTSLEFTVSKGNDFAYHFVAIASTANDTTSQSGYLVIRNDGTVLIVDQIGSFTASYNGTTGVLTITLPSGGYWDYRLERVASRLG